MRALPFLANTRVHPTARFTALLLSMHTTNNASDDVPARDAALARRLGAYLRGEAPLQPRAAADDEALIEALHDYRTDHHMGVEGLAPDASDRLWHRVAQEAGIEAQPTARIFRLSPARTAMAVAASLLVAGVLAFLLLRPPAPDVLAAADATAVTYTADDGTRITLRPHSTLVHLAADANRVRYGLDGEAFFDIPSSDRTVEVDAEDGRVRVLGTSFTVRTWGPSVAVYLVDGRLQFLHTPSGAAREVAPGQRVALTQEGVLSEPETADPAYYTAWMENELQFEERTAADVIAELEYHHNIRITLPEDVQDETLSGRILLDSVAQSLQDLGLVLGGSFEETVDGHYHFRTS